ncbi:ATP-binding protein [Patescibacteria group bacterium]|nr:ATP-binding protein [Patescibacteria group bacterium]MCL5409663.1 ATP-binding protein [Patescibacteria group bacterium]
MNKSGNLSVIYQPQAEINGNPRYLFAHISILTIVWVILALAISVNDLVLTNRFYSNWETVVAAVGGLMVHLILSSVHSREQGPLLQVTKISNALDAVLLSLVMVVTGDFDSPILPLAFLLPVLMILQGGGLRAIVIGAIEVVVLLVGMFISFNTVSLLSSLFRDLLFASSLLLVGFLVDASVKKYSAKEEVNLQEEAKTDQALALLSEEKTKLEEILQNIQDGVITTDIQGRVNLASRKALEILKTSWVAIQDKSIFQIIPFPDPKTLSKGHFQVKLTSLDGETVRVNVSIYSLKSNDSQNKGMIYVIRDVTAENEFEAMKLDFVAMAAHQLRTPLTAIKGYLSLLNESVSNSTRLTEDEKLFLSRSLVSSDRLASLIENLLNVSRIEKGMLKVNLQPIQLDTLVKDVTLASMDSAKQKNIKLILDKMTPPYPQIMGDAHLLGEALSNLIQNGIEYTNPGGYVMVTLQKQADVLAVHVSDNGRGIPADAQPHLFQKFFRASNSLTQLSNGIGLGLFITKSIIEAHKGKIWVNSIEGKGSTFSFAVPTMTTPLLKH